ncbi:thioredoxin fold domain-containing protein [Shewanella sp. SM96]|uniref:thioredoxin fold domain-containing protein n=1 Tax=Shewanella TaxID=22 RepID=UPI0021DA2233|nr:thioredoxin fold domain-containing protein [Shewanella sp. SM96]MCU8005859.1 thioredoxin fold domain-containing protein [Shewanella sp. SM96]
MKISNVKILATVISMAITAPSFAANVAKDEVKAKFENLLPFKVSKVTDSPLADFYQIESEKGIFYASNDGKYIFSGSLHKFSDGLMNLTAIRQRELANEQMAVLQGDLILFPAKDEKYRVTVFTDPTCGYCRKFHSEIRQYNELGITIAYAAFPRGGVKSEMATLLRNVWCSDNQAEALTKSKNDIPVVAKACTDPVDKMYHLGESLGISGTPSIILPNGEMLPGYQPPQQLLQTLENAG